MHNRVHEMLKCLASVAKAKWCQDVIEQTKWRDNDRLHDILLCRQNLVIGLN